MLISYTLPDGMVSPGLFLVLIKKPGSVCGGNPVRAEY